jgi:hypothetical protein
MILSAEEQQWVTDRMKIYDIKYQEIYNEIFDHIVTAIEVKRKEGDTRRIEIVFQNVVDDHFNGYAGIEKLATGQEKIYRKLMGKTFKTIFAGYLTWSLLVFTAICVGLSFVMPDTKLIHKIFITSIAILAFSPLIYTFIAVTKKIKVDKGRKSLLKAHLIGQTYLPAMLLNSIFYLPQFFYLAGSRNTDDSYYNSLKFLPLPALVVVLIFFMITNLSCLRLCNQIIKKEVA